jgi:hypothetical protein
MLRDNRDQFNLIVTGSAVGPRSARVAQTVAIPVKRARKTGSSISRAKCSQSTARRKHSNACFRDVSDADIARLLEKPRFRHRTALRALSVVHATECCKSAAVCRRVHRVMALSNLSHRSSPALEQSTANRSR